MARLWWVLLRATWGWDGFFLSPNFNWFEWINEMAKSWKQPWVYFTQRFFESILIVSSLKKERKKVKATRRSASISFFNSSVNSLRFFFLSGCLQVMVFDATVSRSPRPVRCPTAALLVTGRCHCPTALPACQPACQPAARLPAATLMELWSSVADRQGDSPAPKWVL